MKIADKFDFEEWLYKQLILVRASLSLEDYSFSVYSEEEWAKQGDIEPNCINVIIKYLSASKSFISTIQPIQLVIISEENSLQIAQMIFTKFFNDYNWNLNKVDDLMIKTQVNSPVVISNFEIIGTGYRSALFQTMNLYIIENAFDLQFMTYFADDDTEEEVNYINFSMAYAMSGDVKPFPSEPFAKTTRTLQTLAISLTVPMLKTSKFVNKILSIMNGSTSGNEDINLCFAFGDEMAEFNLYLKLASATIASAPNDIPSLIVGLTL